MDNPKSKPRISRAKLEEVRKKTAVNISLNADIIPRMAIKITGVKGLTPLSGLWALKDAFLAEKRADEKALDTIKGYERGINKLFECLTFNCAENSTEYGKIMDTWTPKYPKPEIWYGGLLPIETLDVIGDIDTLFIDYLKDVDELDNLNSILHYKRSYRVFMYYAMDKGFIKWHKIEVKESLPSKHDVYNDAEIKRLLKAPETEEFNAQRDWVIINYLMGTGNRVSSIVALKINDIDFDDNRIWVCKQKSGKIALISLVKELRPILKQYINDFRSLDSNGDKIKGDEPLFPNWYGSKLSADGLKKAVARYNNSRGVTKTSIHLFRHTYAKRWIMDGGDLISLQQMLGQSSIKMVLHYANLWGRDIQEKADKHALLQQYPRRSGKTIKKNPLRE